MKKNHLPIILFFVLSFLSIGVCYYRYIIKNDFVILQDIDGPLE